MPKLPEWAFEMGNLQMFDTMFQYGDKNADANTIACYKYTFSKPGKYILQ